MIRDRDDRYPALFDPVLADAGVDVVPTGVRIPRMNAISGTPTVAGTFQAAITGHDANPANPSWLTPGCRSVPRARRSTAITSTRCLAEPVGGYAGGPRLEGEPRLRQAAEAARECP
jgi:hypothetical protein